MLREQSWGDDVDEWAVVASCERSGGVLMVGQATLMARGLVG